jgi:hypothetical protein
LRGMTRSDSHSWEKGTICPPTAGIGRRIRLFDMTNRDLKLASAAFDPGKRILDT